jgi:hypothetical protein
VHPFSELASGTQDSALKQGTSVPANGIMKIASSPDQFLEHTLVLSWNAASHAVTNWADAVEAVAPSYVRIGLEMKRVSP